MVSCITLSSLAKVFTDEQPKNTPFKRFSMLKNERSCFQTALYDGSETMIEGAQCDAPTTL